MSKWTFITSTAALDGMERRFILGLRKQFSFASESLDTNDDEGWALTAVADGGRFRILSRNEFTQDEVHHVLWCTGLRQGFLNLSVFERSTPPPPALVSAIEAALKSDLTVTDLERLAEKT